VCTWCGYWLCRWTRCSHPTRHSSPSHSHVLCTDCPTSVCKSQSLKHHAQQYTTLNHRKHVSITRNEGRSLICKYTVLLSLIQLWSVKLHFSVLVKYFTERFLGNCYKWCFALYAMGSLSCLSVCNIGVFCQMVGWIKIPLGLSPGDIVLDGDPVPPPTEWGTAAPHFSAHVYCGQTVAHLSNCWALVTFPSVLRHLVGWQSKAPDL